MKHPLNLRFFLFKAIFSLIIITPGIGQTFKRIYPNADLGGPGIPVSKGGYLINGGTNIVRLDRFGEVIWSAQTNNESGNILELNRGYLLAGSNLMMVSEEGKTLWSRNYLPWTGSISDIQLTSDSCLLLSTFARNDRQTNYIIKANLLGDTLWTVRSDSYQKYVTRPKEIQKGLYCYIDNFSNILQTVNVSGQRGQKINLKVPMRTYSFCLTADSALLAIGFQSRNIGNSVDGDLVLVKVNPVGDTLWTRRYYLTRDPWGTTDIIPNATGDGYAFSLNTNNNWYLFELDSQGNIYNETTFPETSGRSRHSLRNVGSNYMLSGTHAGGLYMYVVVVPGASVTGTDKDDAFRKFFQILPNPFSASSSLTLDRTYQYGNLTIYNTLGNQVLHQDFFDANEIEIPGEALPDGIYTCKVVLEDRAAYVVKLVKQ